MTVRFLKCSDRWGEEILRCPTCGWRGTFESGRAIFYDAVIECSCPKCEHGVLAVVPLPGGGNGAVTCDGEVKGECLASGPGRRGVGIRITLH